MKSSIKIDKARLRFMKAFVNTVLASSVGALFLGAFIDNEQLGRWSLGPAIIGFIVWILIGIKYPHDENIIPSLEEKLIGANKYCMNQHSKMASIDHTIASIMNDGFEYAGEIGNPFNAIMKLYLQNQGKNKMESVLLIEAEAFTMDMLLEYRYLFLGYMEEYHGTSGLRQKHWWMWIWNLRTMVCVKKMTAPLQIMLSTKIVRNRDDDSQVFALIEPERKLYSKAWDPVFPKEAPVPGDWLKKHVLGMEYCGAEHIWKGVGWEEIFFLDWMEKEPKGVHRYGAECLDKVDSVNGVKYTLTEDGYAHLGSTGTFYGAIMDVFVHEKGQDQVTVLVIEADAISSEFLLEHRYFLKEFMERHRRNIGTKWQEGIRLVISVRKMTTELRILLCSQTEYVKPRIYFEKPNSPEVPQVFAMVEEEQNIYTMVYAPGDFYDEIHSWMERHLIQTARGDPEIIWEGLDWSDLGELPKKKDEMIIQVYKALNVWKEGYKED